jgi:hypothetical protein
MERLLDCVASFPVMVVPALALWAIIGLYSMKSGSHCSVTEMLYFCVLLFVSGFTVRTILVDDGCWLAHSASLGALVVAGVLRRPEAVNQDNSILDPELLEMASEFVTTR